MKERLNQFMNQFSMFYIIGLSYEDNIETTYVLEVLSNKGEIQIVNKNRFNSLSDIIAKDLNHHYPILLHVDGDNVITKKIEKSDHYRKDVIFSSDIGAFYFYEYETEEFMYVSTIRNQNIEAIKDTLNTLDRYIVHLTVGPFVLAHLSPFIKTNISSHHYELSFNDNMIDSFKKAETHDNAYTIDGDTILQQETPLIATLVDYLSKDSNIHSDNDVLASNIEQQKFKTWSRVAASIAISIILLMLVISHFSLKSNTAELIEKESELAISKQTLNQLDALKKEQLLKEKILKNSGVVNTDYLSIYLSDISRLIPKSIVLDKVVIKPIDRKIKPQEKITFNINQIQIYGFTKEDKAFISWIKDLRQLEWIKKIDISDYEDNAKRQNKFSIKLAI